MKKVVILGCENSHADTFLNFIKEGAYPEIEVLGVYSDEAEAARKLNGQFGVKIMKTYTEAVGLADGVIVTARHGDNHYKYASPYIKEGAVMFIDKPFTINEEEAVKFIKELKASGVRVSGGSCCKYIDLVQEIKKDHQNNVGGKTLGGLMRAPVTLKNEYGNFFFYSQHLVEMVCEAYGYYPKSVKADNVNGNVTVVFKYEGFNITGLYVSESSLYYVSRHTLSGVKGSVADVNPCFKKEFDEFYGMLTGKEQERDYAELIAPVFVINAINRSMESGTEEAVKRYEI
ncbi:MAG: hypothetical protein E7564_02305 [Ruminococcaceae bacterium]|nr:hypothetical protein [Oscillospiraceae bacterium]